MHQTTIRFGRTVWERIQHAAADEGVSAAQYVREAALVRAFLQERNRGEPVADAFEEIAREIGRISSDPQ
jgi:predicted DNA-binding protein